MNGNGRLSWALVVTDGVGLRTIHPAALDEAARATVASVIFDHVFGAAPSGAVQHVAAPAPRPAAHDPTLTQREAARASGYTGNMCDGCGGFSMRRSGTCETCDACGTTSGGCS